VQSTVPPVLLVPCVSSLRAFASWCGKHRGGILSQPLDKEGSAVLERDVASAVLKRGASGAALECAARADSYWGGLHKKINRVVCFYVLD
jgi:hypothetical protein